MRFALLVIILAKYTTLPLCSGAPNVVVIITDIRLVFQEKAFHILNEWLRSCVCGCALHFMFISGHVCGKARDGSITEQQIEFSHLPCPNKSLMREIQSPALSSAHQKHIPLNTFNKKMQECYVRVSDHNWTPERDVMMRMMMMPFTRSRPHLLRASSLQPLWPMARCDLHKTCFIRCVGTAQ